MIAFGASEQIPCIPLDNGSIGINPMHPDYGNGGAVGDGFHDDTPAVLAAIDQLSLRGGGDLIIPPTARFRLVTPVIFPIRVGVRGHGMQSSGFICDHDGDCLATLYTQNGSTAAFNIFRDMFISTGRPTNVGSGIADRGGSYQRLLRVSITGFRDLVSLDQSEVCTILQCYFDMTNAWTRSGVWIVNGPDRVGGTNRGFTNGIVIKESQFNATQGVNIRDDGGATHAFLDNNYNGGFAAIEAAGVNGLRIQGGASEGHTVRGLSLVKVQALSTVNVGMSQAVDIGGGLGLFDSVTVPITIEAGGSGRIKNVSFGFCSSNPIAFTDQTTAGWEIGNNAKRLIGTGRVAAAFLNSRAEAQDYQQRGMSYVVAGIAAGTRTVTPASMGLAGTSEAIIVGNKLWCVNADDTNGEEVTVIAADATTFTAVFATAKAADWIFYARTNGTQAISPDRGNNSITLTLSDARYQRFATPLSVPQTVTPPPAGAFVGDFFHVFRTVAASGASTLTAFGKALPAGPSWVRGVWDGTSWILTASS